MVTTDLQHQNTCMDQSENERLRRTVLSDCTIVPPFWASISDSNFSLTCHMSHQPECGSGIRRHRVCGRRRGRGLLYNQGRSPTGTGRR